MKNLLIIDGSSLMYRAFYALPPLNTKDGVPTGAVYGFTNMLLKLLEEYKNSDIVVAFDKSRITFRNELFPDYKGHRQATPPELSLQFPLAQELLSAFGITFLELNGFEADDIIGTIATKYQSEYNPIIVTGDRDALQLLSEQIKVLLTKKGISEMKLYGRDEFLEDYKVNPLQLIDIKGLMGDSSDNIPGVAGIGEKTALKLIAEYGSVENVLENIANIKGKKLQENLTNSKDIALLSKQLATIITDVPLEDMRFTIEPNLSAALEIINRLEFRNIALRLQKLFATNELLLVDEQEEVPVEPIVPVPQEIIEDLVQAEKFFSAISCTEIVFSAEFSGTFPSTDLVALHIYHQGVEYLVRSEDIFLWQVAIDWLTNPAAPKIVYEAKKIYQACYVSTGKQMAGIIFDITLASYLLDHGSDHTPAALRLKYHLLPTDNTLKTLEQVYPLIKQDLVDVDMLELFEKMELPLTKVLANMELTGIFVNTDEIDIMAQELKAQLHTLTEKIIECAGQEFNINSPKQLGEILFEKLHLPIIKKTKTGYSTDVEVLEQLADLNPIINYLLEYRTLSKLYSTYLEGLKAIVNPKTKKIHTSFNQMVTVTGRLSSTEPNLQNIPVRTELGKKIRQFFKPSAGYDWLMSLDYSQVELRILASMSHDELMQESFIKEQDVHTRTASEVFGVPLAEVSQEMRTRAKAVNFGIVYGISDYGLGRDLKIPRKQAGEYITNYFARYQGVKMFMNNTIYSAKINGYVSTLFGRRRYLPDINSKNFNRRSFAERTAINAPIQGTAADIIKVAMIEAFDALAERNFKSRILLQVHDELLLEVTEEEKYMVADLIKNIMQGALKLSVPLTVDVSLGKNWSDKKPL